MRLPGSSLSRTTDARMKTWQYLVRLVRYRGWIFWCVVLMYILLYCLFIVPALIARQMLDMLSGGSHASFGIGELMLLLLVVDAARVGASYALIIGEVTYYHTIATLVCSNLFERMLQCSGTHPMTVAPGEAVSRFRDDVGRIHECMSSIYNLIALLCFATITMVIMLRINALITLVVFLPIAGVSVVAKRAYTRIVHYRAASQAATAH